MKKLFFAAAALSLGLDAPLRAEHPQDSEVLLQEQGRDLGKAISRLKSSHQHHKAVRAYSPSEPSPRDEQKFSCIQSQLHVRKSIIAGDALHVSGWLINRCGIMPASLISRLTVGIYRGPIRVREIPIYADAYDGSSYHFKAELSGNRLELYLETGGDGQFSVQGPYSESGTQSLVEIVPVTRADFSVIEPTYQRELWAKPRPADSGRSGRADRDYVAGQLIVTFGRGIELGLAEHILAQEGCRIISRFDLPEPPIQMTVAFPPDRSIEEAEDRLAVRPGVATIHPNFLMPK